jgi:hypothetical protein
MLPRRLLPWLFALTLLFGQAAAFAHALGHLQTDDAALSDQACEACVAQANLGSAATAPVFTLPVAAAESVARPITAAGRVGVCPAHAPARAPPASI